MRVLWFTNTPSNYLHGTNAYNGGGWISSLESVLSKQKGIELGVAFFLNREPSKVTNDGISYYPISNPYAGSFKKKIMSLFIPLLKQERAKLNEYLRVIDDFKPDIINIFGTEQSFGLVTQYIKTPVVIHLQGLLIPYLNAYFPPGYNFFDYFFLDWNPLKMYRRWRSYVVFTQNSIREKSILRCNYHFMGRTEWDKIILSIYNPHASYNYCSEILRDTFYKRCERIIPEELTITTTISNPLYKGFDMVLKCANILKNDMNLNFKWRVFGNINPKLVERKEGIASKDVGVILMGVASQQELMLYISTSTLYVHPSYIDNSPNSVCEAQLLGCTVIGQDVGGMSSLIKQGVTGMLVPANDPFLMAHTIRKLYYNPALNDEIGRKSAEVAFHRHDKEVIVRDLLSIYKEHIGIK